VCLSFLSVYRCPARYGSGQGSVADTLTQRGWMKKIRFLLADDYPLGTSVARRSRIGRRSGRAGGRRREGPHQGGFSLELLPFWKNREVFFCLPHNFHLCFKDHVCLPPVAGSAPEPASLIPTKGLSNGAQPPCRILTKGARSLWNSQAGVLLRLTAPRASLACRLGGFVTNPREQCWLEECTCM
jgi:hypothetical protein